jgi:AcrR family transcriptional regulator
MVENGKLKKHNEKRQFIINIASRVFVEKGFENATLADIAREAGMSKGTLYYYYSSKSDLIFDVAEKHIEVILDSVDQKRELNKGDISPAIALKELFEALNYDVRTKLHLNLVQLAITGNEKIKKRLSEKYNEWIERASETLKLTLPEEFDHKLIAQILIAAIDGMGIQLLLGDERIPFDKVGKYFMR